MIKKVLISATLGLTCLFAASPLALAHALLVTSTPAVHGTVKGPGIAVDLKFNSRVDGQRSRLILVLPNGATQTLALVKQPAPEELAARAELEPGAPAVGSAGRPGQNGEASGTRRHDVYHDCRDDGGTRFESPGTA